MLGYESKAIKLPKFHKEKKLPVVLNPHECKILFSAPGVLKHRVMLSLIYSAGLRVGELCRLKIADIDSGRMMIHIRQSKYNKDRYLPLSPLILQGLRKYFKMYKPVEWLFNGKDATVPITPRGVQWLVRETIKKTKICKDVTVHTLRHSYATHLLENGMDIVSIKELLGHERIETTMVYLHVAKPNRTNLFSPFDRLYKKD
jgi:site-specific recombinase XerD